MRTIVPAAMALAALLSGIAASAMEIELLRNGDFEAANITGNWRLAQWEGKASGTIDTEGAHGGERVLRLSGESDNGTAVASQSFRLLTADDPVTVRGWWRSDVTTGIGARVILRWTDASGEKISDEPALTGEDPFEWKAFELSATPPEGAAGAIVFLEIWKSRGNVWFDDVSATQSIEPSMPVELGVGGTPDVITVGVFDANAAGGRGFGAQGIQEALSGLEGVRCELFTDPSLATLARYDVVVLPNVHKWGVGSAPEVIAEHPELAWLLSPRASLQAYVRMGGGVVLTHQSNGTSEALSPAPFPQVASVPDKTLDPTPTWIAAHPVTAGISTIHPTFADARIVAPGPAGEVLLRNAADEPLAVAGEVGAGRVVGIGLCPGIDAEERPVTVSPGERALLAGAVRWAAADDVRDYALIVAPDPIELNVPEDDIELTLTALALRPTAPKTVMVSVELLDEQFEPVAAIDPVRIEVPMGGSVEVVLDAARLDNGVYYPALQAPGVDRPEVIATVENHAGFARFADSLPRSNFQWACMNVHQPASLKSEEEIAEMARLAREMNFDAVLFAAKPPSAYLYYDTQIGEKDPNFPDLDHLALAVKYCHEQGLQLLVQFCTFREGSASAPSKFIREHPEWADWNPGDGPDISQHQNGVFGCPDRPEVRAYELALMREMAENYDIDGFSFDYIRYKNDRWCVCPFSQQQFQQWCQLHPDLTEAQARAKHAEEQIVSFTWEVRKMLDEVKPEAILHGYCHPTWANRFPLNYLSFRASAHWTQPGRGGPWSLERVFEQAQRNVELADDYVDFMVAAPMADTGYLPYQKPPERFRRELRLISHAGAPAVMIYLYATLRHTPELREVIAEELAD